MPRPRKKRGDSLHRARRASRAHGEAARLPEAAQLQEAQPLSQALARLLEAMSHDLRSPLGSLLVWLELLRTHDLDPSPARAVSMISRSLRDLSDMMGQFLDMSRILAGQLRLEMHPIDLPALVDGVVAAAGTAAEAKGVRLESRVDRSLPLLRGDAPRLGQALTCLVGRAVVATPTGGSVAVELDRIPGGVRIQVRDTGPAIPPEILPGIFEQYRTGGSPAQGSLGLAIARHVVASHGGRLRATTTRDREGGVFILELPLRTPRRPPPDGLSRPRGTR